MTIKRMAATVMTMAMVAAGTLSVSAAEVDFVSNMDYDTFVETRTAQIEAADIDDELKAELLEHIMEVAENGLYGNGPQNGAKGEGNAECILGENEMGIFRSASAGQRTGQGNGVGVKAQDGTGEGSGNKAGSGNGNGGQGVRGNGLKDGSAAGAGFRGQGNDGECLLED